MRFLKVDFMQKNSSNQNWGLIFLNEILFIRFATNKFIFLLNPPLKIEFLVNSSITKVYG